MLKRNITYKDFDDNEVTKEFYFNITKAEIVEMEVEGGKEGLITYLKTIIEAQDAPALIKEFKKVILMAYGIREGDRFIKSDQLREEFQQTNAYSALFMELAFDDGAAATFIKGIMPSDLTDEIDKAAGELTVPGPDSFSPLNPPPTDIAPPAI